MEATLTLDQAGEQLGVDDDALSRLITMGALPEARPEPSPDGTVWVIPQRLLPLVAARNGWTIDLRGARARVTMAPRTAVTTWAGRPEITAEASPAAAETEARSMAPSIADVLDAALLDRLLGAQEAKLVAETQVRESRNALAALNHTHNRVTSELEIERHERMVASDRYREERLARAAADAKVAELRNRVTREMALAESERQARTEALERIAEAERQAADAVAALSWLARRRYRRRSRPKTG